MNDGGLDELAMHLFCYQAGQKDRNGHLVNAHPFKYTCAANILLKKPNFGGIHKDAERQAAHRTISGYQINAGYGGVVLDGDDG